MTKMKHKKKVWYNKPAHKYSFDHIKRYYLRLEYVYRYPSLFLLQLLLYLDINHDLKRIV